MSSKFKQADKRKSSNMNQRIDFTAWLKKNPRMRPKRKKA